MLKWISSVYSSPTALVKPNGVLSDPFSITNGTRQGCPLLPLLFALTLEPFLCRNPNIKDLHIGDSQDKASAYANDLLFSLTNPSISLPNLLREFDLYGALSNLKISFTKSEDMGMEILQSLLQNLRLSFKFKWMDLALKYLGTYVPACLSCTFNLNFP